MLKILPPTEIIVFREMGTLEGRIAVVTGGAAGVGRGIAYELAHSGAQVFVTSRTVQDGERDGSRITAIRCDHREDEQVAAAFARVAQEAGAIDILVNNVWGGYERMMEDGVFTWSKPFWEQPLRRWDAMFDAGGRAHYYTSQLAARSMVGHRRQLIVNISFWAAQKHIGNVAYGVSKAATDNMTADMATEPRPQGELDQVGTAFAPLRFELGVVFFSCARKNRRVLKAPISPD
jgi:NAD(P)-dependent dehydrogenase (short-subunit alcohol dehydrogenase family)